MRRRRAPGRSGHLGPPPSPTSSLTPPCPHASESTAWRRWQRQRHLSGGAARPSRGEGAGPWLKRWREASTLAYPWLVTGGGGARMRALGLLGAGQGRWHKFAGRAGTCTGRAPGWLRGDGALAAAPAWPGWERARLRPHWGPAAPRGALTSAPGALCARGKGLVGGSGQLRLPSQPKAVSGTPPCSVRMECRRVWGHSGQKGKDL